MIVDALILAGGRSSRLGGVPKSQLSVAGVSLLSRTVNAVAHAAVRQTVIVGDEQMDAVVGIREDPAFAGPVAAIAAGLRALPGDADAVLILACDMPEIGAALPSLLADFAGDGAIAVDRGRRQQLAVVVRTSALESAVAMLPTVLDASMRELMSRLHLAEVCVPEGSTDDIDTWEDAERFGATSPLTSGRQT